MVYYPENNEIKVRFFAAIDALVSRGALRGRNSFATKYELNKGNFYQLRTDDTWGIEPAYLTWLVKDFGIRGHWLLTGQGDMFVPGWSPPARTGNKPRTRISDI